MYLCQSDNHQLKENFKEFLISVKRISNLCVGGGGGGGSYIHIEISVLCLVKGWREISDLNAWDRQAGRQALI